MDEINKELLDACVAALKLLRGSGFTDATPTMIQLINAIRRARNR